MLQVISLVVALIALITAVLSMLTMLAGFPSGITLILAVLVIIGGITMALIGIFSSIKRQSRPKITGNIGRAEFYGVVAALFGWTQLWIINLQGRIDQIMLILMQH